MSKAELRKDLLQAAEAGLQDDGLRAVRQAFIAEAASRGFPSAQDEDWRYTNLVPAINLSNDWLEMRASGARPAAPHESPSLPELDAHSVLIVDGLVDQVSLQALQDQAGPALTVCPLRDRTSRVLADGPLDTLNAALLQDGLYIKVGLDFDSSKPLAIFLHDGSTAASQTRIVIDVDPGATIDVIEYHLAGSDSAHFANTVTQLSLAAGAKANVIRLQKRQRQHVQISKLSAVLQRDAVLSHVAFDLGGSLVRNDIVADIREAGAEVHLNGLYLADGKQHIDNHTRVDHRVGPASSREEYRGILNGAARCVFNGKAIVHKGADGTDAEQANHNLLLSARAEVDTKPELEIYADDVKCAHGATVGELDESAIFYMQSRGLDREQASHMLTRAFAAQILSKLPIASMHDYLETLIDNRLDELLEEKSA